MELGIETKREKKDLMEQYLPYMLFHLHILQKFSNLFKSTVFLEILET